MSFPDSLSVSRGEVRDGVSAIKNLDQLLGSRRVGPRQLPYALSEVEAGCEPLSTAITSLETAMAEHLKDDTEGKEALHAILFHAQSRVSELGDVLKNRGQGAIDARERLRLEAIVHKIAAELDTIVRLTDLLGAAATSRSTVIDLGDVLAERRSPSRSLTPVLAVVELRAPVLVGDARIVLELLEFAVASVVRAGVESPRIVAERDPSGLLSITIGPGSRKVESSLSSDPNPRTTRVLDVSLRPELPREGDVVRAAARRAGIRFEVGTEARTVRISL